MRQYEKRKNGAMIGVFLMIGLLASLQFAVAASNNSSTMNAQASNNGTVNITQGQGIMVVIQSQIMHVENLIINFFLGNSSNGTSVSANATADNMTVPVNLTTTNQTSNNLNVTGTNSSSNSTNVTNNNSTTTNWNNTSTNNSSGNNNSTTSNSTSTTNSSLNTSSSGKSDTGENMSNNGQTGITIETQQGIGWVSGGNQSATYARFLAAEQEFNPYGSGTPGGIEQGLGVISIGGTEYRLMLTHEASNESTETYTVLGTNGTLDISQDFKVGSFIVWSGTLNVNGVSYSLHLATLYNEKTLTSQAASESNMSLNSSSTQTLNKLIGDKNMSSGGKSNNSNNNASSSLNSSSNNSTNASASGSNSTNVTGTNSSSNSTNVTNNNSTTTNWNNTSTNSSTNVTLGTNSSTNISASTDTAIGVNINSTGTGNMSGTVSETTEP